MVLNIDERRSYMLYNYVLIFIASNLVMPACENIATFVPRIIKVTCMTKLLIEQKESARFILSFSTSK